MYEIKSRIFLEFDKTQKSALCNFIRALVKKMPDFTADDIFEKFIEDEKYYLEVGSSRFEFLSEIIDDEKFIREVKLFIKECKKFYEYKASMAPVIQAQKDYEKKKRKFLQEVKMSKELPTKKQLSYYNSLCRRHNLDKKDTSNLSKLDLRNMIDEILDEHKTDCKPSCN